jgi:hypothetical protein
MPSKILLNALIVLCGTGMFVERAAVAYDCAGCTSTAPTNSCYDSEDSYSCAGGIPSISTTVTDTGTPEMVTEATCDCCNATICDALTLTWSQTTGFSIKLCLSGGYSLAPGGVGWKIEGEACYEYNNQSTTGGSQPCNAGACGKKYCKVVRTPEDLTVTITVPVTKTSTWSNGYLCWGDCCNLNPETVTTTATCANDTATGSATQYSYTSIQTTLTCPEKCCDPCKNNLGGCS